MKKLLVAILILCISHLCSAMQCTTVSTVGWSGVPTIVTMADPYTYATISERLVDPRLCLSQTFRVLPTETKLKLDKVAIWEDGSAPTQNPYTLRLVDIGTTSPVYPGSTTYSAGTDLWGGAVTFTFNGTTTKGAGEFDFTGAEEVMLTAGHYYAFEITALSPVGGINWYRTSTAVGSTYADGACFVDTISTTPGIRDQLYNTTVGRDYAMAIYLVPEPASVALMTLGGLIFALKRRKQ